MIQDSFLWFQNWCRIHNQKGWKSAMRVQLVTLDNPGWLLRVNLETTELEKQKFPKIERDRSDDDWIFCAIKENMFEAACGPTNLSEAFLIFCKWAEEFLDKKEKQLLEETQSKEQRLIKKNELEWLQYWFYIHCNGDWEHASGIKIEMLDTSNWLLKINLKETELENEIFQNIEPIQTTTELVACSIKNYHFEAVCGLTKLNEVIEIFHSWAEHFLIAPDRKRLQLLQTKGLDFMENNNFEWLQKWYYIHCDGKWEQIKRIHIETINPRGWVVTIDVQATELENKDFRAIKIDKSDYNWVQCDVKNNKFEGRCGPINLSDLFEIFRNWTKPC